VLQLLTELGGLDVSRDEVIGALERCEVRLASSGEAGRVAVLDLMRARTRRFEIVFVLGLEAGSLPRRTHVAVPRRQPAPARAGREA
jgi:inactivated superfamily I helicase